MLAERHTRTLHYLFAIVLCCTFAASVASQSTQANVQSVGRGYPGPVRPVLSSDQPIIGKSVTISAVSCPSTVPAFLAGSLGSSSTPLGRGAMVYVDLETMVVVGPFMTDSSGAWSFTALLPPDAAWAGIEIGLQLVALGPDDIALTNGLLWTLGN